MRHANSPYASPAFNGIGQASTPPRYRDVCFDYTFQATVAANSQSQLQQSIENDADFAWRATVINLSTGNFAVKFSDSDFFNLSSGFIVRDNILGDPSSPFPVFPEIIIPAGGRIGIEIQELSGAQNTIEILLRGAKRYLLDGTGF